MFNSKLSSVRILIIGAGIKPVSEVFKDVTTDQPTHNSLFSDQIEYKVNIASATAMQCAKRGASIYLVSRQINNLEIIRDWIKKDVPDAQIEYSAVDIMDEESVKTLISNIPNDKSLYLLSSVGLGAGTVKILNDNPYLPIEKIPLSLLDAEFNVVKSTYNLLQTLLPRFRKQRETRIVIVSSMSAVRSYLGGSVHCAAKASLSRFANAVMLELFEDNIYITDVRPGGVDTGLYDNPIVINAIKKARKNYGLSTDTIHLIPPLSVGETIASIFDSEAHITSINLVARGQPPNESS